mmetsp:Transcript_6160/g.15460  ORF Transcript_6160/g.15460 Transcript_6160/m.15460 type:complete len:1101 (-) Transcript_6160:132-3434(-)
MFRFGRRLSASAATVTTVAATTTGTSSTDKATSASKDPNSTPKKMKTIDDTEKTAKSSSSGGGKSSTLTAASADDSSQVVVMKKKLAKVEKTLAKHGKGHPDYAKLCQKRENYKSSLAKLNVSATNNKDKVKESGGSAADGATGKDTSNNGSTASGSKSQNTSSKKKHHHHSKKTDGHRRGDHSHSHTHSGRTITATSTRKARTAAAAAAAAASATEDAVISNGHESFATNLSTDTRATVPETPFQGSASGIGVVCGAEGDDDSISLLNSPKRTSSIASPVGRTLPGGPPLASPYANQRTPLVLAQEDDEAVDENEDENTDLPLFCKLYQKVAVTSLSNGTSSLVHDVHTPQRFLNIGFVRLPSRLESTFKDARQVMEDELVPDVIDFDFKFVIPSLGPVAQKQEAMFGPLVSQDHQHNTSSGSGNGSERSYNTLTSHTHRSNATQRTAVTAGTMPPAAILGSLENPLQLVIVNCGPRKLDKTSSSKATSAGGISEEAWSAPTTDKDMSVTGHDKKEAPAPLTSLTVSVSENEKGLDEDVDDDDEESMDRGWRIIKQTGSISHRSRLSTSIPHTISGHAEDYEDETNVQLPSSPITSPSASSRKSAKGPEGGNDHHSSASKKESPISRNNSQDSHDLDTPLLDSLLAGVSGDNKDADGNNMSSFDRASDDNATNISVVQSTADDSKRGVMELLKNLQARAVDAGIVAPVADTVDEQPSSSDLPAQTTQNDSASNRVTFNADAGSERLNTEEAQTKKGQLAMYLGSKVDDLSEGDGGDTEIFSVSCDARAWLQYKKEKKQLLQDEHSDDSDEEDEDEEDDSASYDEDEARRWISTKAVIQPVDDEDDEKAEEKDETEEEDSDESENEVETEAELKAEDLSGHIEEEAASTDKAAGLSSSSNIVEEVDPIFEPSVPSSSDHDEVEDLGEIESVKAEDSLSDKTENDDEDAGNSAEEAGLPLSFVEPDENEDIQVTTEEPVEPEMETADECESSDDEIIEVVAHKPKLLMLVTLYAGNREIMPKQKRAQMMLESCGLQPVMIDGSAPEMREKRNSLFDIAGEGSRGQYPLFFKDDGRSCQYIGNFESLEDMEEHGTLGNILSD